MSHIDYAAAQKEFRRGKSALTRAINSKDPDKVIRTVDAFFAKFDKEGWPYPDDWARWERARDDARFTKQRSQKWNPRHRLKDRKYAGSPANWHQLQVARQTLKMSDIGARVMGGMTKEEARRVIRRITGRKPKENPYRRKRRNCGCKKYRRNSGKKRCRLCGGARLIPMGKSGRWQKYRCPDCGSYGNKSILRKRSSRRRR